MNPWQQEKYRLLGLTLAYYRRLRDLTQEKLAEAAGVDRVTVAKIETGTVGASLDTIFDLADALEIEPYKLFEFRR